MAPTPLLLRPPALPNPPLPPPRCAPAVAAAAACRSAPTAASTVAPSSRLRTRCRFAASNVREDYSSTPIDIVADVKTEKIVVLGGSGFVGSAICKAAVSKGIEVVSLSRSGRPSYTDPWVDQVTWLAGDVFYARWDEVLVGATAAVSTIGGFGNEEQMKRINGEANVIAVDAAKEFGIPKFILISVHDYNLPSFLLTSGYFTGKRKAESEVLSKYPASGVVLRPAFIYGKRRVNGYDIPLDVVGQPLEKLLNSVENFTKPLSSLPASDLILAPPVSVDDVADAVVNAVIDDSFFGVFTIEQIKEAAAKVVRRLGLRAGETSTTIQGFIVAAHALLEVGNQQRSNDAEAPNIAERRPLENNHQWRHYGPQPWIGGDFLDPSLDLFQSN